MNLIERLSYRKMGTSPVFKSAPFLTALLYILSMCSSSESAQGEKNKDIIDMLEDQNEMLVGLAEKLDECCSAGGPFNVSTGAYPKDCAEISVRSGHSASSGMYAIQPDDEDPFFVYCDMDTAGGGWTVFQRREDGSVDFYRDYLEYKSGFGRVSGEHWLGNEKIHRLTSQNFYDLRIDLEDFEGDARYAEFKEFSVADEALDYQVMVEDYSGTAGDALTPKHDGMKFSARDRDNDNRSGTPSCAEEYRGGWWYDKCHQTNLNGQYRQYGENDPIPFGRGVTWVTFKGQEYSLKRAEMKIRPRDF